MSFFCDIVVDKWKVTRYGWCMTDAEVKMVTDCVGRLDRLAVETTVALQAARANMLAMATRLEAAEKELAATQVRKTLDSESANVTGA